MRSYIQLLICFFFFHVSCFAEEQRTIKLGVLAPLTGDFAQLGRSIQQGIELATQELQSENKKLEVFYEDACFPQEAIAAGKKLLQNNVDAIVGNFCVIGMVPLMPFLKRANIIAFQSSATPDALLRPEGHVFTTNVTIREEARALARYARTTLGKSRAGILSFPSDWGSDYSKYFTHEFEHLGGKVIASDVTSISQMDFRTELTRMKSKHVDLIFGAHLSNALGNMTKQAKDLRMDVQFVSTDEAEDPQFFTAAGSTAHEMHILVPELTSPTKSSLLFQQNFQKNFLIQATNLSANAYDATRLAVLAISSCQFEKDCIRKTVADTKNYKGVSGTFSIQADGSTKKSFVVKRATGKNFIRQGTLQ